MNIQEELLAKPAETIREHTENVLKVASHIMSRLPHVLEKLSLSLRDNFYFGTKSKREELEDFINELIRFHDYGKVNPVFQKHINGIPQPKSERQHTLYSFLMWLVHLEETCQLNGNKQVFNTRSVIGCGVILGHHGSLKEVKDRFSDDHFDDLINENIPLLHTWGVLDEDEVECLEELVEDLTELSFGSEDIALLTCCKLAFSILVASDSIASSNIQSEEYEIAVQNLLFKDMKRTDISETIEGSPIIKHVNGSPLRATMPFSQATNLNEVRVLLNKKCVAAQSDEVFIYIMEAPVGTGKTLSSLAMANEIAKRENKQKMIAVFPLNSVQSQYKQTILEDVGIDDRHVNVINSESLFKLDFDGSGKEDEERPFEVTDSNLWLWERNFFSNELLITSHVRFFDTLVSVSRQSSLGFLGLIDSVVIIDEFQNYPEKYWESIWSEMIKLSEILGVRWIFTTGTFPVSNRQLSDTFGERVKYVLTEEEHRELFLSPFVKDRCDLEMLTENQYKSTDDLYEDLLSNIIQQEEQNGYSQFLICMSFVRHVKELYHHLHHTLEERGYTTYFMCGRHSASYKEEMLKVIKEHNKDENRQDKIVLFTTKTVECGMDFDFDYGYKEFDMFDSVEQLSGRVNRSGKRPHGGVSLFYFLRRYQDKEKLYKRDTPTLNKLQQKEFRLLYEEMYDYNKMELKKREEFMNVFHNRLMYEDYRKYMTIIEEQDYITDIYLVTNEQEETFNNILKGMPFSNDYAEKMIHSILLRKRLEPYRMTVTTKWLKTWRESYLEQVEVGGLVYFRINEERLPEIVETYTLNGIVSYLERDMVQIEVNNGVA